MCLLSVGWTVSCANFSVKRLTKTSMSAPIISSWSFFYLMINAEEWITFQLKGSTTILTYEDNIGSLCDSLLQVLTTFFFA